MKESETLKKMSEVMSNIPPMSFSGIPVVVDTELEGNQYFLNVSPEIYKQFVEGSERNGG